MTFDEDIENIIKVTALKNAIEYGGKSRTDTVIAKIMASARHRPATNPST